MKLEPEDPRPRAAYDAIIGRTAYRNFDLAMWDWIPLIDPDFMLSVLTCESFGDWNDTGYCNQAYDKLYSQQGAAIDPAAAAADRLPDAADDRLNAQPYLVLDYPDSIEAQSSHWSRPA